MSLLGARPDLALADPTNLAEVAARMVTAPSARAYYDRADQAARQVIEALCVLPAPTTVETLANVLGTTPDALGSVLERLGAAGALIHSGPSVLANPGFAASIARPCGLGLPAATLLTKLPYPELTAMGRSLGLAVPSAKSATVATIARALGDVDRLAALLRMAPRGTEELFETAARWPDLDVTHGVATARRRHGPLGWCLERGLLLATGWSTVTMPREVAIAIRRGSLFPAFSPIAPVLVSTPADPKAADRRAADAALAILADVTAIGEAWSRAPAKLIQSGGIGVRDVRRAAKLIGRGEDATARLIELMAHAGLIGTEGGAVMPTGGYDQWRRSPSAKRWLVLASTWLSLPCHLSVTGARDEDDKPVPPLFDRYLAPEALAQRVLVLALAASKGPGEAVDAVALTTCAEWQVPALWVEGPAEPTILISWLLAEAELLGVTGSGAVGSFGRLLLDGNVEEAEHVLSGLCPPVATEMILQADLTAVVAGEAAPSLRAELELLADVESSGHATVWRFSPNSLLRGLEAGRSSEQILAWLTRHATRGVPQPLAYLVGDLGRRFGQIGVGVAGCYVRSDDPSLLAEIVRAKKTAKLRLRSLAPTVAVTDVGPAIVTAALRDGGYLPASEGPDGTLTVSRPAARRTRPGRAGADLQDDAYDEDDDYEDDDYEDDPFSGYDDEAFAELLADPSSFAALTGLPPSLAVTLTQELTDGGNPLGRVQDLEVLVARLRQAPLTSSERPAQGRQRREPASPSPFPHVQLFDPDSSRPSHIATTPTAIAELLDRAASEQWPVRMAYTNAKGDEREFFAEILQADRLGIRVRYLFDRAGGTELVPYRVQWVRVLTAAEERAKYR
jgi:hypothetical protein